AVIGETGTFAGVLECMPDDILASLANGRRTTYSAKIDLICLARAFYLMLHKPPNPERVSFGGNPDISSRAQNILVFWGSNAKSELWDRIFQDTEGLKYEGVIEELEKSVWHPDYWVALEISYKGKLNRHVTFSYNTLELNQTILKFSPAVKKLTGLGHFKTDS
ncbi:7696_t:CDS:2, partial [Ambispora gerdemannii]